MNFYCISLQRKRLERFIKLEQQCKKQGINLIEFKAIDMMDYQNINQLNKKFHINIDPSIRLDVGSIGCSQRAVWKLVKESKTPSIIFEDDAQIHPRFLEELSKYSYQDFDFVLLGVTSTSLYQNNIHKFINNMAVLKSFWGLHGYYLTPKGAQKLLDQTYNLKYNIDVQVSLALKEIPALTESLVDQRSNVNSTIHLNRHFWFDQYFQFMKKDYFSIPNPEFFIVVTNWSFFHIFLGLVLDWYSLIFLQSVLFFSEIFYYGVSLPEINFWYKYKNRINYDSDEFMSKIFDLLLSLVGNYLVRFLIS